MATVSQAWDFLGVGQQFPIKSAVVVSEGDLVALDSNGQIVLADTDTGPVSAHGFAFFPDTMVKSARTGVAGLTVKAAIATKGVLTGLSSLTPGGNIYLSATAAGVTGTAPTTNTHLRQVVGVALAADTVQIDIRPNDLKFQTSGNSTVAFI